MTSNEKQILKVIYNQKGKASIHLVANQTKLSSDYCRLMCHSLERAGYLELIGLNFCQVSSKGQEYFSGGDEKKIVAKKIIVKSEDKQISSQKTAREKPIKTFRAYSSLDNLQDISSEEKTHLVKAGYKSLKDLAKAPIAKLIQGLDIDINIKKAADWINQARRAKGIIRDEADEAKEIENET